MDTLRILLFDTTPSIKRLLERTGAASRATRFEVTLAEPTNDEPVLGVHDRLGLRAILFGEKLPAAVVLTSAKSIRSRGVMAPMLLLTRQSEARVPRSFRRAGVDDTLNVAEMSTPLFPWTFTSSLRQIEDRRKAKCFDELAAKLVDVRRSLSVITHDVNNPLSVMRLIHYHLSNPKLSEEKRVELLHTLAESIDKVSHRIEALRLVRQQLDGSSS